MLHGRLTFKHLATADAIVGDNSRALLRLVSGIHATVTCMAPFSKATVSPYSDSLKSILLRTLINPDAKQQAGIVPFPIHPALCRNVPHSSSQDMTTINGMNTMKAFHNNDARSLMVLHHLKMTQSRGSKTSHPTHFKDTVGEDRGWLLATDPHDTTRRSPQAASARLLMTEAVRSELFPPGSTRDISWQDPWKRRLQVTYGQSESQMTMTDGSRVRIVHEPAPVTRPDIRCAWSTASPQEVPLEETVREGTDTDSVQLEACERTLARAECSARNPRVIRILLRRYGKAISCGDANLRRTNLVQHRIETGGAQPVKLPPRRLPQAQREVVDHLIREMLHAGDLSPPFCVDYRRLNAVTRVNAQPMPHIDDTLTALAGAKWFSTLDLASGYWQVEVAGRDREKTVFSTPLGLFQFRVIPFGLCKAPATFQRLEKALRGLTWNTCLVYLDGIMVFGKTEEDGHVPTLIHRKAAHLKLR
ncbi:Retrovirus-related Pol polyprotein from transposon 17.6 [Trichinella britovi]|uniref:Retrovirus-related Pol polyprotein from transposon 17.6 n=1 Tax=Trichinella britovi TaxID=45882 RepID=A0A0V1CR97_TRIBR|nr:Retrovirus-related Pol polyprotein from transposon 17.6 [Trichinella britovi]